MPIGIIRGWLKKGSIFQYLVNDGTDRAVFDEAGFLYQRGVKIDTSAATLNALTANLTATAVSTAQKVCSVNGLNNIAVGTGFVGGTLAAPTIGAVCTLRAISLTSGTATIKLPVNVVFIDGNNTAVFDAVSDTLMLQYKSATQWDIVLNQSVTLSLT